MMYGSWDIRHDKQSFLSFWAFFALWPSWQPEKSKFWKKKTPEHINSLHLHTKNDDHMMCGSWDMERDRPNFSSIWVIFWPFTPLTTPKIKILKKWKSTWRYHYFMQVYHKWQSYDVWFLECEMWGTEFFAILGLFLPFYNTNNPKNQNFEKMKKTLGDIIILHKCTKNHNHMLYYSWDMAHNGCNFYFSFRAIFCPFTSLTAWKIKIYKKWKKHLEISFYNTASKIMIICYTVPEIWRLTDVIIFRFGPYV